MLLYSAAFLEQADNQRGPEPVCALATALSMSGPSNSPSTRCHKHTHAHLPEDNQAETAVPTRVSPVLTCTRPIARLSASASSMPFRPPERAFTKHSSGHSWMASTASGRMCSSSAVGTLSCSRQQWA